MKKKSRKPPKARIPKYAQPLTHCPYCACPIPLNMEFCSKICQVRDKHAMEDKDSIAPRLKWETRQEYLEWLGGIYINRREEDNEE